MALKTHNTHINVKGYVYSGTSSVNGSAVIQIDSTTQGALLPRMTTGQRDVISTPATSLLLYNVTTGRYNYYSGSGWVSISIPVGPNGQVQYYKNGEFQSSSDLYFDEVYSSLGIGTSGTTWGRLDVKGGDDLVTSMNSVMRNSSNALLHVVYNDGSIYGKAIEAMSATNNDVRLGFGTPQNVAGNNTIIGKNSLSQLLTGDVQNVSLGDGSGSAITSGDANLFLGYNAGPVTAGAYSNKLYLHNAQSNSPLLYGEFDNRLLKTYGRFDIKSNGTTNATYATLVQNSTPTTLFSIKDNAEIFFSGSQAITDKYFPISFNTFLGDGVVGAGNISHTGAVEGWVNTAIGWHSLYAITTGYYNTAIGSSSLDALTTGFANIALGHSALGGIVDGSGNVGVGYQALDANVSGINNTAIGSDVGGVMTSGDYNVLIGSIATATTSTVNNSTILGTAAGYNLSSSTRDIVIGREAGMSVNVASTSSDNIYIGYRAAYDAQNSSGNIAIGKEAGYRLQSNSFNPNWLIGYRAGYNMTTAANNVAIADKALMTMVTGAGNTAIGPQALWNLDGSIGNDAIGTNALNSLTTGDYNAAHGGQGMGSLTSGSFNTSLGYGAGGQLTTGDSNVYLGFNAGPNTLVSQSNKLYLHNSQSDSPLIYGEFDNRLFKIYGRIDSKSNGNTSATSAIYLANSSSTKLFEVKDDGSTSLKNYSLPLADGTAGQVLTTDGAGAVSWKYSPEQFGMFWMGGSVPQGIATAGGSGQYHAIIGFTQGATWVNGGITYKASATGNITAYASGGAGVTICTSAGHSLSNGDVITIVGTTNYNTTHLVSGVTANTFNIDANFVANDATGQYRRGSCYVLPATGKYKVSFSGNITIASGTNITVSISCYSSKSIKSYLTRACEVDDTTATGGINIAGYIDANAGENLHLQIRNASSTDNVNIIYSTFTVERLL